MAYVVYFVKSICNNNLVKEINLVMSSYALMVNDDGSGNFDVEVFNSPATKPAGGTRITIPWLVNANGLPSPNNLVISSATTATPIVATTASVHGLTTGDVVTITGGLVENINGTYTVTVTTSTAFQLDGSVGSGTYTASSAVVKKLTKAKEVATAIQAGLRGVLDDRASGN